MKPQSEKFRFQRFEVSHHRSTMKVGTDAVVLGAWIDGSAARTILEVGTGCGIIALMLAQKTTANIDAIDIDEDSVKEAGENFNNSPWNNRIKSFNTSLNDFAKEKTAFYDLILSNPPFFENSLLPPSEKRQLARHQTDLTFDEFIYTSSRLLSQNGRVGLILPASAEIAFIEIAKTNHLYLHSKLDIFPKPSKPKKRVILVFSKQITENPKAESITLRNEDGSYTNDYKWLAKDFHIDF